MIKLIAVLYYCCNQYLNAAQNCMQNIMQLVVIKEFTMTKIVKCYFTEILLAKYLLQKNLNYRKINKMYHNIQDII